MGALLIIISLVGGVRTEVTSVQKCEAAVEAINTDVPRVAHAYCLPPK
jgi:hypothetical protein